MKASNHIESSLESFTNVLENINKRLANIETKLDNLCEVKIKELNTEVEY
jgi:archaellum component FlaC